MRLTVRRIVAANIFILLATGGLPESVADEALVKRFREEAPRKWQEYKPPLFGFERQYDTLTEDISTQTKDHMTGRFLCGADGARAYLEVRWKKTNEEEKVRICVSNPDYDFELRKPAGPKEPFSIYDIKNHRKQGKVGYPLNLVSSKEEAICFAFPLHFNRLISSSDFRVMNASEVGRDGNRLVQIEFAYHLKNPRPDEKLLVGRYTGTVCFDPDSYWAITEAKLKVEDDPRKEVSAIDTYKVIAKALRGIPVIVETRILWYDLKGNLARRETVKSEWKEYTGGDEQFTLSAYGFPEPGLSRPSKKRMWFLSVSVALTVLFIVLLIYRRKRASVTVVTSLEATPIQQQTGDPSHEQSTSP